MKRVHAYTAGTAFVGVLLGVLTAEIAPAMAQQPPCPDPARRTEIVTLARAINTAQMRSLQVKKEYQPLSGLTKVVPPQGLSVQLLNTPEGYVFSIKDEQASCGFTVFSDQDQLIYTAQPLQ